MAGFLYTPQENTITKKLVENETVDYKQQLLNRLGKGVNHE